MQTETTRDERTWGMLAYLSTIVGPILAPLIIYFVKKDQSRFVAVHAVQSVLLGLACVAFAVTSVVLGVVLRMIPVVGEVLFIQLVIAPYVLWVGLLIFAIVASIRAYNGDWFQAPLVGAWAEDLAGSQPYPAAEAETAPVPAEEAAPEEPRARRRSRGADAGPEIEV
jgi:uncharacterized Tic20 family protein